MTQLLLKKLRRQAQYYKGKENARRIAQELQIYQDAISWGELAERGAYLEKLAKKYGLVKEFKENGIF